MNCGGLMVMKMGFVHRHAKGFVFWSCNYLLSHVKWPGLYQIAKSFGILDMWYSLIHFETSFYTLMVLSLITELNIIFNVLVLYLYELLFDLIKISWIRIDLIRLKTPENSNYVCSLDYQKPAAPVVRMSNFNSILLLTSYRVKGSVLLSTQSSHRHSRGI